MRANSQGAPASFDAALQAIEAEEARRGFSPVAILAPLADVSPPDNGDFCPVPGYGPFGYEPLTNKPATEEFRSWPPPRGSLIKEVAAELSLSRASTPEALHRLRRDFMWRNHPDRRPDLSAQWSNARVAIANMLIDRALQERSSGRQAPV